MSKHDHHEKAAHHLEAAAHHHREAHKAHHADDHHKAARMPTWRTDTSSMHMSITSTRQSITRSIIPSIRITRSIGER
jgi:hypothetical protein